MLTQANQLAESGRHAAVLELLQGRPDEDVVDSPTLALLCGIAHGRLGGHEVAERWVGIALERARARGDRAIETRAENVRGAIALERGQVADAAVSFAQARAVAEREGDHATVGRCSNNLGIVHAMQGRLAEAVGAYTMAVAAFQQAGLRHGVAETLHNLAKTYRVQGDFDTARKIAGEAVREAEASGDVALTAQARAGCAEIQLQGGDPRVAGREIEGALQTHRRLGDRVREAEDLRVLGNVLAALGDPDRADKTLRDVIERAEALERPLLAAEAGRDLARLLLASRRTAEAREWARTARARFWALGAEAEVAALDKLLTAPA